jgi:hypothetical protein
MVRGLWAVLSVFLLSSGLALSGQAREWTDASGRFSFEAELISYSDQHVILKMPDERLVSVALDQLSDADRQFVDETRERGIAEPAPQPQQTWNLANGQQLVGEVVEYGKRTVEIRRSRGRLYVNDRPFDQLPKIYQDLVLRLISHHENLNINQLSDVTAFLSRQPRQRVAYEVEGVMLELENGEMYGVPFMMFSEEDRRLLRTGYRSWLQAHQEDSYRHDEESLMLRTQAQMFQQADRQMELQMQRMQLQLLGAAAGLFSFWQIELLPPLGMGGFPLIVVVPARNSQEASMLAQQNYPGFRIGLSRRLN